MSFKFKCQSCDELHEGMPSFGSPAPRAYYEIPESERAARCRLSTDECVIDGAWFFVRGCIEIHVHGETDPFSWGVWVQLLNASDHNQWRAAFDLPKRSHIGPFYGWLSAWLKPYPETVKLKALVHLRDDRLRPYIELEPTDHPLAVEQRHGITVERVAEIYGQMMPH